ncbi:Acg family FMN-binding oxidoreductase [Nonomuraea jiangxiensis]|uniref:Nitroreductase family protein n=1 Tax=Nonomuraea jiangxiensis TaxID=633440 RepID=A0A1G9MIP1_9ACTN|nr:nitroreductase family protein [Nonomuraea jiangxiensis]SDL74004.1 Nitroreductase family protein [Nonomuraea jiangxiensis]
MSIRSPKRALDAAVEAGRWAPSVHNTQPWSFAVTGEEISLRADTSRKLPVSDAAGRELLISCGAALFTMSTAMRCEGYEPAVRILPDPDRPGLVATIRPGEELEADELTRVLGGEIERRRTHRAGFADVPLPDRLIESLARGAMREGAKLTPIRAPAAVHVLAALTQAAQGVQAQDERFSLELIRWSRPPGSTRTDGVPAEAYPREPVPTEPDFPQRRYSWRHGWGTRAEPAEVSTGVVAVVTTRGDGREEWIAAGQALQRVLLHASAHGVSAAFHTQALELDLLREFLRQELCSGEYPQMVMRLGVTFDSKDVPRRPLTDILE